MAAPDTGLPPIGLQPYDEALQLFFTQRVYPDPAVQDEYEILIPVTGPPVLNLGTQAALNRTSEESPSTRQNQIVKLPATAVTQLNWTFDLRRWTRAHFRRLGWTEEGQKVIQSNQVIPLDIMYQLDMWSKYRTTMNQMVRNIMLKFTNREVWLDVDLKGVWGVRSIPLTFFYDGPKNLSDLEPDDKDRTVRMAFTFILHAWVIPDANMLPAVRTIMQDIYYPTNLSVPYPDPTSLPPYPDWLRVGTASQVIASIPVSNIPP